MHRTDDVGGEVDDEQTTGRERRSKYRRTKDRKLHDMATAAMTAALRAADSIDRHVADCAENYTALRAERLHMPATRTLGIPPIGVAGLLCLEARDMGVRGGAVLEG